MTHFEPRLYGKHLLLSRIARGGMSELFRAKIIGSKGFEKLVAIKQILPHLSDQEEFITAFTDEARLAALLQHRNIVQIYDFGEIADSYFLSMEYLSGKTLREFQQKAECESWAIGLDQILFFVSEVCAGLDYAHKLTDLYGKPLSIIHRDIGPRRPAGCQRRGRIDR